jgi:hypothetical protein
MQDKNMPTIKNFFSAIKSYFRASSIPVLPFLSQHLALAISSLEKNSPPSLPSKPIFSPPQLIALFSRLSSLPLHALYRVAFSFSFLAIWFRWTKTLQRLNQSAHIQLFSIHFSPLCPLRAFNIPNIIFLSAPRILSFLIALSVASLFFLKVTFGASCAS